MQSPSGNSNLQPRPATRSKRRAGGSVLPLMVVSLMAIFCFFSLAVDIMRDFQSVNQLEFAANASALYGMSFATNADGSYSTAAAQNNILNAITSGAASGWNVAQSGPASTGSSSSGAFQSPVSFGASSVSFINNPNPSDPTDVFVQVKAAEDGDNALKQFFLPVAYSAYSLTGTPVPAWTKTISTFKITEVLGQPAERIGAGSATVQAAGSRAALMANFAALPLAISNQQFQVYSNAALAGSNPYVIDLVGSTSAEYSIPPPAGHIKGCLVNVGANAGSSSYYGPSQGDIAINQLEGLLAYFGAASPQPVNPPNVVECGVSLGGFDPSDSAFVNRQTEIASVLTKLPRKYYIVPVIAQDPILTGINPGNTVVGFAYLMVSSVTVDNTGAATSITVNIADSVLPVANASVGTGIQSVPPLTGTAMPPPVAPFLPRSTIQTGSNATGISARQRGVVLAPAESPRIIPQVPGQ